jgi:glycosyltransferase involved in cell wall biosynthesis
MISIIICTYNYGHYLDRCIQSVLDQSIHNEPFEIILIDDGSEDETGKILQRYGKKIKILTHSKNFGLGTSCNTGILNSTGEYFIRVDADDELLPGSLQDLFTSLKRSPQSALVYGDRVNCDSNGATKIFKHTDEINIYNIIAPGVMFRTSRVIEAGMYRNIYWEEHDLMIRLLSRWPAIYIQKSVYKYYLHGNNMTLSSISRIDGWKYLINLWGISELRKWGYEEEMESVYNQMMVEN